MPPYKWLYDNKPMDYSLIEAKMKTMVILGVPYTDAEISNARKSIEEQATKIEKSLYNDPDFVKSYEESMKNAKVKVKLLFL